MHTRFIALAMVAVITLALPSGCEAPNSGVAATQPKSADKSSSPSESPQRDATASQPVASQPASRATTESKPADDANADDPKLPPYIKILERSGPGPARIEVTVDGDQRITLKTTNVAKFRITRKESPLAKDRSVALRIDTVGVEWTRARQTLILQRTSTGDWLSEEEVEKKP